MIPPRRSALRRLLGSAVRRLDREAQWRLRPSLFRLWRSPEVLPFEIASHSSPLFRDLPGVDHALQMNKVVNLRLAAGRLDGMILEPGRRLSFWHEVGPPTHRRGFLDGMVLTGGRIGSGVGGGLCQMTNLLFWMTLHTPLSVLERWRHGYDVFPDSDRTQPFGSGATCSWPSLDLQIGNPTLFPFRLSVRVTDEDLAGAWTSMTPCGVEYRIEEREHRITFEYPGVYIRSNELWRIECNPVASRLSETLIARNRALMTYRPLIQPPRQGGAGMSRGPIPRRSGPLHRPEASRSRQGPELSDVAGMLAPWMAVSVFWIWLRSAWATILVYHALILLLSCRHLREVTKGWDIRLALASALPCLLAGPLTWVILPSMVRIPVDQWLSIHGLSGLSLILILPYYGLVHPVLEQAHWGRLRNRPGLAVPASAMFAGYHGLVLSTLMEPVWIAACLAVLFGSSLAWTAISRRTGGLAVPALSHAAADSGMILAAFLLAR